MLKGSIGNYHHLVLTGLVRVVESLLSFNPSFRFFVSKRNQIHNIISSFLHQRSTIYYMAYSLPQHRPINHRDAKPRKTNMDEYAPICTHQAVRSPVTMSVSKVSYKYDQNIRSDPC